MFDYGVNSGIGRSGKVLRRVLKLPDNTSAVNDAVIAAARAADAKALIVAICDERLRFLQSLQDLGRVRRRLGPARGGGEVGRAGDGERARRRRTCSHASAAGRAVVPVAKGAQQGSAGAIVAAGAAAAQQAHQSGHAPGVIAVVDRCYALRPPSPPGCSGTGGNASNRSSRHEQA